MVKPVENLLLKNHNAPINHNRKLFATHSSVFCYGLKARLAEKSI
jgi:hypothetical protein